MSRPFRCPPGLTTGLSVAGASYGATDSTVRDYEAVLAADEPPACRSRPARGLEGGSARTELRHVAGVEAASQALGHRDLSTTLGIYGHQDQRDLAGQWKPLRKAARPRSMKL